MTLEKGKIADSKKNQWLPRFTGRGRGELAEHKGFSGSDTILYDTIMMNICHYTFVQTYRLTNYNKCTTVEGMQIMGEAT